MSAEPLPGQMSFTASEIRSALAEVETPETEAEIFRPLARIESAAAVVRLAQQLLDEQVAEARAARHPRSRVVLVGGEPTEVARGKSPVPEVYSWDVIAKVLTLAGIKMSGERARQIYGK